MCALLTAESSEWAYAQYQHLCVAVGQLFSSQRQNIANSHESQVQKRFRINNKMLKMTIIRLIIFYPVYSHSYSNKNLIRIQTEFKIQFCWQFQMEFVLLSLPIQMHRIVAFTLKSVQLPSRNACVCMCAVRVLMVVVGLSWITSKIA